MSRLTFLSPCFHYTFGPHEPALRVRSGQLLRIICPDSDNVMSDGQPLPAERRQRDSGSPLMEGNPLAGPILVEDAQPGDTIAIDIEAIVLDRAVGQTGLASGAGLLPMHSLVSDENGGDLGSVPRHLYRWRIDAAANEARLSNALGPDPIAVPLNPFVGCLGVCPEWGQSVSSLYAGSFGGNMDIPALRSGSSVLFPLYRTGGLVFLGDLHAAQGHGEIIGGAIETSGMVDVRIRLMKGSRIAGPRVRDTKLLMAVASSGDLREAVQTAYARLLDWLACDLKLNRWDAYNLMSQTGSITVGNLVTSPYSVGASIPINVLPMAASRELLA